ncbi:MAG: hypothetical protein Q8Q85_15775 [Gemmatimonadales bacterium]|nr:hypothetical protein [Gemmatimonadales bacterium]
MKKTRKQPIDRDTMRPEYDFSGGVRGKYAGRFPRDVTVVLLEPDVAAAYPDSQSVNRALRAILDAAPARPRRSRRRTA